MKSMMAYSLFLIIVLTSEPLLCASHCVREALYVQYLIYLMFYIYYSSSDSFLIQNPWVRCIFEFRVFQILES